MGTGLQNNNTALKYEQQSSPDIFMIEKHTSAKEPAITAKESSTSVKEPVISVLWGGYD